MVKTKAGTPETELANAQTELKQLREQNEKLE
jgi:hypothetical protein